jgi:hypothetical protein
MKKYSLAPPPPTRKHPTKNHEDGVGGGYYEKY